MMTGTGNQNSDYCDRAGSDEAGVSLTVPLPPWAAPDAEEARVLWVLAYLGGVDGPYVS